MNQENKSLTLIVFSVIIGLVCAGLVLYLIWAISKGVGNGFLGDAIFTSILFLIGATFLFYLSKILFKFGKGILPSNRKIKINSWIIFISILILGFYGSGDIHGLGGEGGLIWISYLFMPAIVGLTIIITGVLIIIEYRKAISTNLHK